MNERPLKKEELGVEEEGEKGGEGYIKGGRVECRGVILSINNGNGHEHHNYLSQV